MEECKSKYSKSGSYAGYDKNNKEREALDFYSTPVEEVVNILNVINLPFSNEDTILEPCAGGGHMIKGIEEHLKMRELNPNIIATEIKDRSVNVSNTPIRFGKEYDILSDNYPIEEADYVIMNPPYGIIEPFTMHALSIAKKGVLALCRLQFLEGQSRFDKIFSICPPSDVYVYADRICCFKNGDTNVKPASIQAYAWYYWDLTKEEAGTQLYWIRRANK